MMNLLFPKDMKMVDLLPANRKRRKDEDNDSVLPTDWLECTVEAHPSLDQSFGPGTWKCLMMGDLMTQYGASTPEPPGSLVIFKVQRHGNTIWRLKRKSRLFKWLM